MHTYMYIGILYIHINLHVYIYFSIYWKSWIHTDISSYILVSEFPYFNFLIWKQEAWLPLSFFNSVFDE